MDSGEEIPGLNEDWTFAGAKLFEWVAGFMALLIASELFVVNAGQSMPLLVAVMVMTTFGLASLRRGFPDEERGVRNLIMLNLGFPPPGVPTPSKLQPLWSGSPLREFDEKSQFKELGLDQVFFRDPLDDQENY